MWGYLPVEELPVLAGQDAAVVHTGGGGPQGGGGVEVGQGGAQYLGYPAETFIGSIRQVPKL